MSLVMRSVAGAKFYCDLETCDVFEENAEGRFVLKRVDGQRERVPVESIPDSAQLLFCDIHKAWDFVR